MARFAEGSTNANVSRLQSATLRALDAHIATGHHAERLIEEIDQVTSPGVIRIPMSDEDSLVIAIKEAAAHS